MILSFAALSLMAGAVPATQVCPDGAVILASETCKATAPQKPDWVYLCLARPRSALPTGYRRSWTLKRYGASLELGETGTATEYRAWPGESYRGGPIEFTENGRAATVEVIGAAADDKDAVSIRIGEDGKPPFAYTCRKLDE